MEMASVERAAYRSRWDDGLVDLFAGLALVWIGAAWLWLDSFAGLAGILPAIVAGPFVAFRSRFLDERAGYVRFSDERRRWERRNMAVLLAAGVLMLGVGIVVYVVAVDAGSPSDLLEAMVPGLVAVLTAIPVAFVAAATRLLRAWVYCVALVVGGGAAMLFDLNPGAPLLVAGVVMAGVGVWLLVQFVRAHPADSGDEVPAS